MNRLYTCLMIISLSVSELAISQDRTSIDELITELAIIESDSITCDASAYWNLVALGEESIPALIENLSNPRLTEIYNGCKGGKLTVGELCYFVLEEIVEIPVFSITKIQYDLFEKRNGWNCWNFYDDFYDLDKRSTLKRQFKEFYESRTFKFRKFDKTQVSECHMQYSITGQYQLRN